MAKIYKIIKHPAASLRKKSKNVDVSKIGSKEFLMFYRNMVETMLKNDGIGLAAPQIGKNIRVAVINTADGPICLVNPKIIKTSLTKEIGEEGCLSVPGVYGKVKRHKKVVCNYINEKKEAVAIEASGLFARVIQHELDHLDGVLFIDIVLPEKTKKGEY